VFFPYLYWHFYTRTLHTLRTLGSDFSSEEHRWRAHVFIAISTAVCFFNTSESRFPPTLAQVVVHGQDVITSYRYPPDMLFRVYRGDRWYGNYNFSNWVTTPSGYYTCDSDDPYIQSAIIVNRLGIRWKKFHIICVITLYYMLYYSGNFGFIFYFILSFPWEFLPSRRRLGGI